MPELLSIQTDEDIMKTQMSNWCADVGRKHLGIHDILWNSDDSSTEIDTTLDDRTLY